MSRLTPAERRQIISDYKHGIANPDYRVIDRGDGTFQVRKRDSKFKAFIKKPEVEEVPQEVEAEPEPKKETKKESTRLTNEELLLKLSKLLDIPRQEPDMTPQEYEEEKEAYEDDQRYIEQNMPYAGTPYNPYMRRPLRLY